MHYKILWAFTTACALSISAWAQTWNEQGDAGDTPETAQSTGSGTLTAIQGDLETDGVDMYAIYITDSSSFSASTVGGATWDTQLFLFDSNGKGVVSEDDTDGTQSTINNTNGCIQGPGLYYLAITRFNKDPLGCEGVGLWSSNDNNCPNGPESTSRVASWTSSSSTAGAYTITLMGVEGATVGDPDDCPPPPSGVEWNESDDAGDLPETAQATGTDNSQNLVAINGSLGENDVDMFAIYIADPSQFRASTSTDTTDFDSQLWLFDANGNGIVHDDDSGGGSRSAISNANSCIPSAGLYYIAISRYNRDARDCDDGAIWSSATNACALSTATRVNGWSGTTSAGTYRINLRGASTSPLGQDPDDCPPFEGWDEQVDGGGDAGDLPGNAQIVNRPASNPCQDPVTRIRGDMEADGVDMYVICITDPSNFVATTTGGASWDTQLWLFRCDGTGIVFGDDDPTISSGTTSRIDNSTNCLTGLQQGAYLLAITRYNRDAVDASGQLIWENQPFRAIRCPDGPGASNPIAGWTDYAYPAPGAYSILLTGSYFVSPDGCAGGGCEGDVNGDGMVDDADLLQVLFDFGCSGFCGPSDVNNDSTVDDTDLLIVLFNFGCGA